VEILLALIATGVFGTGGVMWWRSAPRRTRRVLKKTRVTPIAQLVDGQLACIVGRVEADAESIESLIARKKCVAFDTTTNVFDGVLFTSPVRIETTRRMVPFYVVDETGRVRVDAAQVALSNRPVARTDRYVERVLLEGMRVRIVGSVVLDPTAANHVDHHFRETGAVNATITGTAKFPLLADSED
jgi:hypothetical protein